MEGTKKEGRFGRRNDAAPRLSLEPKIVEMRGGGAEGKYHMMCGNDTHEKGGIIELHLVHKRNRKGERNGHRMRR